MRPTSPSRAPRLTFALDLSGRSPQDEIVRRYLQLWVRDLLRLVPLPDAEEAGERRLLYVDGFAGAERRFGRAAAPDGEPDAAAARLLTVFQASADHLGRPRGWLNALLIEEDPAYLARLREALGEVGLGERVREGADARSLGAGEIALVQGEWREVARAEALPGGWCVLQLLDPPAPGALPLASLRPCLAAGHELLVLFPGAALQRQSRFPTGSLTDLPPYARRAVEGYSALLGDPAHGWLIEFRAVEGERGPEAGEEAVAERYLAALREAGAGGVTRRVPIRAPGADGAAHLLLHARDPGRALELNESLFRGRSEGWLEREEPAALVREEAAGELELFGGRAGGGGGLLREPNLPEIANRISREMAGRTLTLAEVLAHLGGSGLFPGEVRRALTALRRDGRALFRSLADGEARIAFPRGRDARRMGGRRRRSRAPELFGPGEGGGGAAEGDEGDEGATGGR